MILSASSVTALSDYGSSWYFFDRQLDLGARRRDRVRRGVELRLPPVAAVRSAGCSVSRSRAWSSCSCPASGSWSTDRAAGWASARSACSPPRSRKVALLCCGANVLSRRADRLDDWHAVGPRARDPGRSRSARDARARPRLRDRARADRLRAADRRRRPPAPPRHARHDGGRARSPASRSRRPTAGRACWRSCIRGTTRRAPATRSRSR